MPRVIGIMGRVDKHKNVHCSAPYGNFFRQFGQVVIIDPLIDDPDDIGKINLLVLPGGEDVSSFRYGHKPHIFSNPPNIFAEYFDTQIVPKFIDKEVPVFGICRGFQTLNVLFGGELAQHIMQEHSDPRTERVHKLEEVHKPPFQYHLEPVNSLHHQGMFPDTLAPSLTPIFIHRGKEKDKQLQFKNVEAFIHKEKPIIGVQWHPEEIWDDFSLKAVAYLLK